MILQHLLDGPRHLSREATSIYHCICSHMTFRFGDEWWALTPNRPNTGTQQGSPISAGLFALVLGEAVDQLFNGWINSRQVRPRHRDHAGRLLFGWCYADDCIFNFDSWVSFKTGLSDIIAAFAELGLHLNLDKTQLVVHPDWYQEGLDFFASDPAHTAMQCKWVTVGEHLRRPFKHYQAETSVSTWVLETALKATHAGWESIARPLKACDWHSPAEALVLLNRYVFSKWSFLAPMLEPLQSVLQPIRKLQTTMVVLMLKLHIPHTLSSARAVALNRQRRRVAQQLLRLNPRRQWVYAVVKRKWTYVGHCLRRTTQSLELAALYAPSRLEQALAVGGPWNHMLSWALQACQALGLLPEGTDQSGDVAALAQDKVLWNDRADRLAMQHVDGLGYFLPQIWESWRHPLQASEFSAWYLPVFVVLYQGSLWSVMLDKTVGVACFQVDDLVQVCSYGLMNQQVCNIDVFVDPDVQDCVLWEFGDRYLECLSSRVESCSVEVFGPLLKNSEGQGWQSSSPGSKGFP